MFEKSLLFLRLYLSSPTEESANVAGVPHSRNIAGKMLKS